MTATINSSSRWDRFRNRAPPASEQASPAWPGSSHLLNVIGWGVLSLFVAPNHYGLGASGVFGIGLGCHSFRLGMRHAFDADHIAAIDKHYP
jgi:nickel/cobalt transporter (NiCoT) family protein